MKAETLRIIDPNCGSKLAQQFQIKQYLYHGREYGMR
jgi:YHS domain-containing protein